MEDLCLKGQGAWHRESFVGICMCSLLHRRQIVPVCTKHCDCCSDQGMLTHKADPQGILDITEVLDVLSGTG